LFRRFVGGISDWYKGLVGSRLRRIGLRYEDCLLETPDVERAVKMLPLHEQTLRQRRIKRAFDLSLKHEELPPEIQKLQDPFNFYLQPLVRKARKIREERERHGIIDD